MAEKLRVAVLGATGIVGQRFVARLSRHPWFELEALYASPEKAGRRYGDVVEWVIDEEPGGGAWEMRLRRLRVEDVVQEGFDMVFSALSSSVASAVEAEMARLGARIVSNASPYRMERDIPLLNPEVNADHAALVVKQARRGWKGWIAKVPNCSTAILTLALKPIHDEYRIRRVIVATMQAVSGAGLRGVPATMITDNIIPHIPGEEEKLARETRKILGHLGNGEVIQADMTVTAITTRVPVLDGHLEAVFIEVEKTPQTPQEVAATLEEYKGNKIKNLKLPTAPQKPVIVKHEENRPQPRLDRNAGDGMTVTAGRIKIDRQNNTIRMIILGHNTVRGAAGTGILIGELMHKQGHTS
ncbi:MAG: aspartate-semialdehyde dehydrogenase [Desulfurococcales archaeon]|nr:aspartate-semialdehyde dehydrogenase [Desulfurococcales archaeon]